MSVSCDSRRPDLLGIRWVRYYPNAYWVECDFCFYDGEAGNDFTKEFAFSKLNEHRACHTHPEVMDKTIAKIAKEMQ